MSNSRLSSLVVLALGVAIGWFSSHSQWMRRSEAQEAGVGSVAAADQAAGIDGEAAASPLETLDWLTGDWVSENDDAGIKFSCKFTKNNAFLVRSFSSGQGDSAMTGMQVVAWDPAQQILRSWTFDSDGGFGEDAWTQSGNRYTIRTKYTLADGGIGSALNVMTYIDDDTFTWRSVNREIDGVLQMDLDEVTLVRAVESAAGDATSESGETKS